MYIATIVRARLIEHIVQSECRLRSGFDTTGSGQGRLTRLCVPAPISNLYVRNTPYKLVLQVPVLWFLIFIWGIKYKILLGSSYVKYIHQGFPIYHPILEMTAFGTKLILDRSVCERKKNAIRKLNSEKCALPSDPPLCILA
jgi:hypothetical protein